MGRHGAGTPLLVILSGAGSLPPAQAQLVQQVFGCRYLFLLQMRVLHLAKRQLDQVTPSEFQGRVQQLSALDLLQNDLHLVDALLIDACGLRAVNGNAQHPDVALAKRLGDQVRGLDLQQQLQGGLDLSLVDASQLLGLRDGRPQRRGLSRHDGCGQLISRLLLPDQILRPSELRVSDAEARALGLLYGQLQGLHEARRFI
mmetsp:Transcript_77691/g.222682  ORF Transcript_77691/g.222682 Transcript_77691/m.222682 type:complete len:201 (-) Transcript_77691:288-890(-)